MKTTTGVFAAIISVIGLIGPAVTPALQHLISGHPIWTAAVAAVSALLALFHNPVATA